MKFSFSKLKKAFGKSDSNEDTQEDTYTIELIKSIEQKPFAISRDNICFASANELAGYYYLQTVVVGKFKIKTFDGAQLKVLGTNFELKLDSDMMELESEPFHVPKSYMTRMDFILDESDLPKISRSQINAFVFTVKKQRVEFSTIQINEEEE